MRLAPAGSGRTGVVGSAVAATLVAGVVVAALGQATTGPAEPAGLTAAEAALDPAPLDALSTDSLSEPADRSRDAAPAPAPAPPVKPLAGLRVPDLVVTVSSPVTPEQVQALQAVKDVKGVTVADSGVVKVGGEDARVVGVDPSDFRAFTPQETAASDPLWKAVARGELAASYGLARERGLPLGETVTVGGPSEVPARLGAVAAYGLPGVDLVTDRTLARSLGAAPSSTVIVSAPDRGIDGLRKAVATVLGKDAKVEVLRPEVVARKAGRPTTYRELYIDSARYCPGLSWTILAAIGQVESAHGKHLGPSSAGALGPMQFMPATWAAYGIDGDGDGKADIMSPYDAVPSAASYLCRHGANRGSQGLYDAIFAYNHADWYVRKVLGVAAQYK